MSLNPEMLVAVSDILLFIVQFHMSLLPLAIQMYLEIGVMEKDIKTSRFGT